MNRRAAAGAAPRAVSRRWAPRVSGPVLRAAHFITSSAASSRRSGTFKPRALRFQVDDELNFTGCSTGSSAGFAPWRMRST